MKNNIATLISLVFPPCVIKNMLLRLVGWNVAYSARIGFSYICVKKLTLCDGSNIGHGNYIKIDYLHMDDMSYIQKFNQIRGPIVLIMKQQAGIGNFNNIVRAKRPISWGHSILKLGKLSKITSKHTVDCMRSIIFGNFSTLAGYNSEIWTHGFMHASSGAGRYRVDGSVKIGDNVYIGSASIINPGIRIADAVTVGSNSSVSKSLLKPGLYVNQPLRFLEFNYEQGLRKYPKVLLNGLKQDVVHKKHD